MKPLNQINALFIRKCGINSILISNFIPYEYYDIKPSDLSSNTILMIGRGDDKTKRFDLGIKAMKHVISEIYNSELKIISSLNNIYYLFKLTKDLNLIILLNFRLYI